MTKRMLIDASHAEETRVVVVDGRRIEELDFESQSLKQLRGNIYLAKVTRVEPSLQAAFVEYGGNRHGFLAFNEIHPDYYQIPVADREALMREEAEEVEKDRKRDRGGNGRSSAAHPDEAHDDDTDSASDDGEIRIRTENGVEVEEDDDDDVMEEEVERRRRRLMRRYKIQEVIRRRQIMLVQVVKEERGNKGAALTTYLSLAGRYSVLMPNTARGGGISRKITAAADRKRLKAAAQSLELPPGMGLIIRTAGAKRTKLEIKRDHEYLMRLWENVRDTTLKSIAPALIYEEEDLVKRALRDMYDKELDGVWVEGEAGYKEARDFMRMIMPSQAKKIQAYRDPTPLFVASGIEDQLSQIHSPIVPLKSGGYLVINQTEALVAIDVNSGKSTRERNVEATALKTNLEAAEEAARQLRLRDLAGLIVIDFIDMDESKNNRAVEKVLKDCLRFDRARIQMGKISGFGLMEISRQRRRSGILEGTTHICSHCNGAGRVRSTESSALAALRAVEMEGVRGGPGTATVRLPVAVALYILNEKRAYLDHIDEVHGLKVAVAVDEALGHTDVFVDRTSTREEDPDKPRTVTRTRFVPIEADDDAASEIDEEEEDDEEETEVAVAAPAQRDVEPRGDEDSEESRRGGPRRRRRRRGGRGRDDFEPDQAPRSAEEVAVDAEAPAESEEAEDEDGPEEFDASGERRPRRRRRGRRGGRRVHGDGTEAPASADPYAWTHAHGDAAGAGDEDPYAWRDSAAPPAVAVAVDQAPQRAAPEPRPEFAPADETSSSGAEAGEIYAWVEEPAAPPADAKPRRRARGRGRGRAEAAVDAPSVDADGLGSNDLTPELNVGRAETTGVDPGGLDPAELSVEAAAAALGVADPIVTDSVTAEDAAGLASGALNPAEPTDDAGADADPVNAEPVALDPVETEAAVAPTLPIELAAESGPVEEAAVQLAETLDAALGVAPDANGAETRSEPEPEPVAREPDPNEVSGPPAAPRRGWWRLRG